MIKQVLIGILCGGGVLTIGILIGHYGIAKSSNPAPSWMKDVTKDVDESLIQRFMSEVDNMQIQENLRSVDWYNEKPLHCLIKMKIFTYIGSQGLINITAYNCGASLIPLKMNVSLFRELTRVPHMATTPGDEQTVQLMLKRWQDPETGLDEAWTEEYMVYLSFPDPKNPNKVTVGESNGCRI